MNSIALSMKFFWKYIFPAVFGLIIYTTVRLVNDTTAKAKFWERPWYTTAIEIVTVIIVGYLAQWLLNYHIRKFNKQHNKPINGKTIAKEFATVYFSLFILINLTVIPMAALTDDGLGVNDFIICHIVPGLYALLYFAIVRGNNYLKDYVLQKTQLEKISNDQLQTELKFLKAQYHPHFLFNALNTVYFQMDEDVAAAKHTVEKFSELLRYQLYDQQQTVPVSQEIHYLQNFIDIQKMRTSERLKLQTHFDASLNGQQVYPLLFLPLVENAFKYVGGDYHISIDAKGNADELEFTVINSLPSEVPAEKQNGIGLGNLKRRLELLYPGKHSLVAQIDKDTFCASIKINIV
jgi:two-component system, LytTR family, sensor kinase